VPQLRRLELERAEKKSYSRQRPTQRSRACKLPILLSFPLHRETPEAGPP